MCGSGGGVRGFGGLVFGFENLGIDVGIVIVGVGRPDKVWVRMWLEMGSRKPGDPGYQMIFQLSLVYLGLGI